ncbi:hypothetical protein HMPREF1624_02880 [Sporothrix schenckii ATCC 58251]|uniref:Uncharacterized protein n=1 Tax=Sporothrix schenckii (strain ATCC 58251 / de Perez 2211183) TaxID=1391915 RepID=U7Q193_SPOS1|nr:hypothetical protein HMPREF1624_02880 [Sporothrix schenckii ATCC 58251]
MTTMDSASGLGVPDAPAAPRSSEAPAPTTARALILDTSPDTLADDASIYGVEDDAQSFMQPTMSPIATRLSLPRTPAAEKAMAMDDIINANIGAGFSDPYKPAVSSRLHSATISTPPSAPAPAAPPLAPAHESKPSAMLSVFQSGTRHGRSSSVGSDALKRLSKALPSMPSIASLSFPSKSSFLPSLSTPSFFSSSNAGNNSTTSSVQNLPPSPTRASDHNQAGVQRTLKTSDPDPNSRPRTSHMATVTTSQTNSPAGDLSDTTSGRLPLNRPPSVASKRSYVLRRSTSDDSLLYHTLSRVPSHGDEAQFVHIREQVNSRMKAIMDSFDRPTFKMPQLPSFFPDAKHTTALVPREPASPLDAALEDLTGDIVVLGGYRGSILRSAEPPHRQLWVPVKVGLNIRKVNMEVGLDPEDEENMPQTIFPSGMLKHIGPVDISRRLFKKLRESENARKGTLRVHDYGYDWRLSPHRLSKQLIAFLESLPCNQPGAKPGSRGAVVIAHSLGGLITRHAVNQRPDLFGGVIFAGTPQRCINILGPLRNGDAVLLNEKVLTAQVNFTLRTTFVFLPEDGFCFVNSNDASEEYRVNFYDIKEWMRYRWSPCVAPAALPAFQSLMGSGSGIGLNLGLDGSGHDSSLSNKRSSTNFGRALTAAAAATASLAKDRLNAPQMDADGVVADDNAAESSHMVLPPGLATTSGASATNEALDVAFTTTSSAPPTPPADPQQARAVAYLIRTLAETKQFRAEMAHRPEHTAANVYPPMAVIYGKGTPTVYAARVGSRAAIACADAYDDLVFRTGDGVVLAREAQLPPGYHYVRDGYVSTDRGHVGMLGDLNAVGKALAAVVRGRQKGIGHGLERTHSKVTDQVSDLPSGHVHQNLQTPAPLPTITTTAPTAVGTASFSQTVSTSIEATS